MLYMVFRSPCFFPSGPGEDIFRSERATGDPQEAHVSNFLHPVLYYYKTLPTGKVYYKLFIKVNPYVCFVRLSCGCWKITLFTVVHPQEVYFLVPNLYTVHKCVIGKVMKYLLWHRLKYLTLVLYFLSSSSWSWLCGAKLYHQAVGIKNQCQ